MSTPEGPVKKITKELLLKYKIHPAKDAGAFPPDAEGWYFMASQNGFGVKGIADFIGHYRGIFWAIEAKAPGVAPTGFQALQISEIRNSGAVCFVVDGAESLKLFQEWLDEQSI